MYVPKIEEQFIKLRKAVEICSSNTPSIALLVGKYTEEAFNDGKINKNVSIAIIEKANILTTTFKHDCICNELNR